MSNALNTEAYGQIEAIFRGMLDAKFGPDFDARIFEKIASATAAASAPKFEKGCAAARQIMALAARQLLKTDPNIWMKTRWGDEVATSLALGSDSVSGGGAAVRPDFAAELIEYLRPAAVVRQLNPVIIGTSSGTVTIPKMVTGTTGTWIGENQSTGVTVPTFGNVVSTSKKLAAMVPIGNDFLRRSIPGADVMVRDDLVAAIAQAEDLAFIQGSGTAFTPKGLHTWTDSGNIVAAGSASAQQAAIDLWKPIQYLKAANVPLRRPGYIMSPRTERYLMTVQTANSVYPFKEEMLRGQINGFPYKVTSQVPENLSAGGQNDNTYILFADFSQVVIVDELNISVDTSSEAMYVDSNNVSTSAFQNDQTLIRVIKETDLIVRHTKGVFLLNNCRWGA